MAERSAIEWTDATWNPVRAMVFDAFDARMGWHCEHVSEGCRFCYAEAMNRWRGTGLDFRPGHRERANIFLDETMLEQPLRWRKPRMVFAGSMTDLFADFVLYEWIKRMFAVMALCPQHTFQVLTKRPKKMAEYIASVPDGEDGLWPAAVDLVGVGKARTMRDVWPLPNVWLGTSCEDQATAAERIPHLLATPAAVRFVSAEPLLGPIRLSRLRLQPGLWLDARTGAHEGTLEHLPLPPRLPGLDWLIAGGESGPNARPMHPDWPCALRDECQAAGVPFFFKQWGEWSPAHMDNVDAAREDRFPDALGGDRTRWSLDEHCACTEHMVRLGKKRAGRLLDGREHNGMPEVAAS